MFFLEVRLFLSIRQEVVYNLKGRILSNLIYRGTIAAVKGGEAIDSDYIHPRSVRHLLRGLNLIQHQILNLPHHYTREQGDEEPTEEQRKIW